MDEIPWCKFWKRKSTKGTVQNGKYPHVWKDGHRVNSSAGLPSEHDGEVWRAKKGFYVCLFVMFWQWIVQALKIYSICLEGLSDRPIGGGGGGRGGCGGGWGGALSLFPFVRYSIGMCLMYFEGYLYTHFQVCHLSLLVILKPGDSHFWHICVLYT